MITIVNLAHPIMDAHMSEVERMVGQEVDRVVNISSQVDLHRPLAPQVARMVDAAEAEIDGWDRVVVHPPKLAISACLVLAEIHRRHGRFPRLMRLARRAGPFPEWYVVEVLHP